jgi:hypothetical protein
MNIELKKEIYHILIIKKEGLRWRGPAADVNYRLTLS